MPRVGTAVDRIIEAPKEAEMLLKIVLAVVAIIIIVIILSNARSYEDVQARNHRMAAGIAANGGQRALLVIAHPDDETMFFAPLLKMFVENNMPFYILCLSNGDHDHLGDIREHEMENLVSTIHSDIMFGDLEDRPGTMWSSADILPIVQKAISKWNIDVVFTFDEHGASGHANHISCFEAIRELEVLKYKLVSGSRFLGSLPGTIGDDMVAMSKSTRYAYDLMKHHESQFTWWRKLGIAMSSHTYVNRFVQI